MSIFHIGRYFKNSYINYILFLSSLEWQIVGRKKECRGTEEFIGNFADIARCADACKDRSSMFIHGIRSEGENGCFCETIHGNSESQKSQKSDR